MKNISKALIKVSHVCNNNCIFCHSKKECIVLNLKQIKKKILKVKSLEIKCILLSGGEVTIRDDFFDILDFIQKNDLTIGLITNGRIFASKSFFNKLKNYNIAYLFISLHGSNPATHDSITKVPGSFEQGLLALKNINGQDTEPIVNFVILKENLHQLIEFIELMNKFNVKRIKFSLVNPPKSLNEISVPKMDIAAEKVKMGIDFANINYKNITIRWDGFPLCLMEGYENNLTNLKTEKILYLSYPWETDFSPPDEKDKVKIKQCNSCSKKDLCKGIYARYLKQANTLNPSK